MERKGLTMIDVFMGIVAGFVIVFVLLAALLYHPDPWKWDTCVSNLKQIYTSMYTYSQDYEGKFPQVLPGGMILGEDKAERNLKPGRPEDPFKDFPAGANHSVSENLWLLCRTDFVQPEVFVCPVSPEAGSKVSAQDKTGLGAEYFVNFPWKISGTTISYSFIQPWSRFEKKDTGSWRMWSADADPRLVLGADANNNSRPDFTSGKVPPSYDDLIHFVNSTNHQGEGQNMVFGDGHVEYKKSAFVGIDRDNVYTALSENFTGKSGDTPGILSVRPKNMEDTVLIPNKDANLAKWNRRP